MRQEKKLWRTVEPVSCTVLYRAGSREELDEISRDFFEKMSMTDPDGEEIVFQNKIPKYLYKEK